MYAIAGITGHVGSTVAKELLAKGQKLRAIVRDAKKAEIWSKQGAEVAVGGLDDAAFLTTALKGVQGFFTLLPPDFSPPDIFVNQKKKADAMATAIKQAAVPHVVLLSSLGADHEKGNGPIAGLYYFEHKLRETGAKVTAIRAGSFQENVGMNLGPARGSGIFPNMSASADYPVGLIATRDIGALAARSLLQPPGRSEVIDLDGPAYSVRDQARILGAALGKELKVVDVPAAAQVGTLTQAGMPPYAAASFAEMYAFFSSGVVKPVGDRHEKGTTRLEDTVKTLI